MGVKGSGRRGRGWGARRPLLAVRPPGLPLKRQLPRPALSPGLIPAAQGLLPTAFPHTFRPVASRRGSSLPGNRVAGRLERLRCTRLGRGGGRRGCALRSWVLGPRRSSRQRRAWDSCGLLCPPKPGARLPGAFFSCRLRSPELDLDPSWTLKTAPVGPELCGQRATLGDRHTLRNFLRFLNFIVC